MESIYISFWTSTTAWKPSSAMRSSIAKLFRQHLSQKTSHYPSYPPPKFGKMSFLPKGGIRYFKVSQYQLSSPLKPYVFGGKKSGRIRTSVWRSQCWQSHLCWLLVPYITISFNRACVSRQICFLLVLVDMVADLAYMTFMNQYIAVGIRAFYSRQVGAAHLTHLTHLPLFKWAPPTWPTWPTWPGPLGLPCTTKYNKVLRQYASTTLYYKVLRQYYSVLQSTTSVLLRTTKYYSTTTLYYTVLRHQYYFVLQSTTPVLLCATPVLRQFYSVQHSTTPVLLSTNKVATPVLLCTTKYHASTILCTTKYDAILQSSTTPVLVCTTKNYSSTSLYNKVLLQYYSLQQSSYARTTPYYPVLLKVLRKYVSRSTKYYSSTTLYNKVLCRYYSVLQSTKPVLLCTTKYYASTTLYNKVTITPVLLCAAKYYSTVLLCTTKYYKVLGQYYSCTTKYYSVLQSTTLYNKVLRQSLLRTNKSTTPVLLCATKYDANSFRCTTKY